MWAPSCVGLCTYHTSIHNLLYPILEVIIRQITDMALLLEQFQGLGGTWMCKVVHCFHYPAQDGDSNQCPTVHPDMGGGGVVVHATGRCHTQCVS